MACKRSGVQIPLAPLEKCSTSAPPAADERVTIPTGEPPVFTPTPEELVAPPETGVRSSTEGVGGRGGDASGGDEHRRALMVGLGASAAGLGGLLLARRTKRRAPASRRSGDVSCGRLRLDRRSPGEEPAGRL
jgi:hypothetical protein